jgi:hypothetical protein
MVYNRNLGRLEVRRGTHRVHKSNLGRLEVRRRNPVR